MGWEMFVALFSTGFTRGYCNITLIGCDVTYYNSINYDILQKMMADTHGMKVLELATGSGSVVRFLAEDNNYTGSDISVSLLRQAKRKIERADFKDSKFYVTSTENSLFEKNSFQVCLCILAINFLNDLNQLALELSQILQPRGVFYCCVPVP